MQAFTEMKIYIGMMIHMEYLCVRLTCSDYWQNDGLTSLNSLLVMKILPDRLLKLIEGRTLCVISYSFVSQ